MAYSQSDKMITETIEIDGTVSEVWSVLTELEDWETWNPFIVKSEGEATVGSKIKNHMVSNGKAMTFKPKVLVAAPNKEFTWLGHLLIPGIFDGRHSFVLREIEDGKVELTQHEVFKGIFSGLILKKIGKETAENFRKMNEALKNEVETGS